jgi:hypothetical protein
MYFAWVRIRSDRATSYDWAKVVSEVAPLTGMNVGIVRAVVVKEERCRP